MADNDSTASTTREQPAAAGAAGWKPSAESKRTATTLRWIAVALWFAAIAAEAVAIFWLLGPAVRQDQVAHNADGTLTETTGAFPDWALWRLVGFFVLIGALSITGSMLWKRANRLDPPSTKEGFMDWVTTQLGSILAILAILAIVAFLPLIVLVLLNKDMSSSQKATAGIIGGVVALAAVVLGVDFNPPSVEKYYADKTAVILLLGEDRTYWTARGSVYHVCEDVSDLRNSEVVSGTTEEAVAAGETRLTLGLESELTACGRPVPTNIDAIVQSIRDIRDGQQDVVLPLPEWPRGRGCARAPRRHRDRGLSPRGPPTSKAGSADEGDGLGRVQLRPWSRRRVRSAPSPSRAAMQSRRVRNSSARASG